MSMQDFSGALAPQSYDGSSGSYGDPSGGQNIDYQGPGADPDQDGDPGQDPQYTTSLDALDGAEEALHAFIQLDPDHADRAVAATCLQNILKLKAKQQQAGGGGGDMTSLARALQGTAGGQ